MAQSRLSFTKRLLRKDILPLPSRAREDDGRSIVKRWSAGGLVPNGPYGFVLSLFVIALKVWLCTRHLHPRLWLEFHRSR